MRDAWRTPRAIALHLTLAVSVPGFLALGWWQLHRALGGNSLSWAYTFEWPFFAGYAIYTWWRLLRDFSSGPEARTGRGSRRRASSSETRATAGGPPGDREYDDELAAYNRYLASLHERDGGGRP